MQRRKRNRLLFISLTFLSILSGVFLILYNLEQNITFFYPPSRLKEINLNKEIRIGGLVKFGSIKKINTNKIHFIISDNIDEIEISYEGLIPALFREKQGIIAKGKLIKNIFVAKELLTKHDENYLPPELSKMANSLK